MKKIVLITDLDNLIYPITTTNSIQRDTYNKNLYNNIKHLIVTPLVKGTVSLGTALVTLNDSGNIISECAMLVPFTGVSVDIKLPQNISIKFIYGKFDRLPTDNTAHSLDLESKALYNGDSFTFPEEYDLYRVKFLGIDNIDKVKQYIKEGTISLTYESKYGDVITNNKYNELFVLSIRVHSVNNYTVKYLPTFAHASDFHCDVVRLQNFLDYCDYLKLKIAVITGDFCALITSDGFSYALELFENHNVIPIICPGNHDKTTGYNSYTVPKYNTFFLKVAKKYNYSINGSSNYYYLDATLEDLNVRFIALDLYEVSSYGYNVSREQTLWLISVLKNTPANYKVFIAMHQKEVPIIKDVESGNFYEETMAYDDSAKTEANGLLKGDILFNIVKNFLNKTKNSQSITVTLPKNGDTFTLDSGAIDFTNAKAQFVAFLSGHTHRDAVGINKSEDATRLLHLNISCDNTSRYNLRDLPINKGNSTNSDVINIYSIEDEYVNIVRVGSFVSHETNLRLYTKINYVTTAKEPSEPITKEDLVESTGNSSELVMSLKGVTNAILKASDAIYNDLGNTVGNIENTISNLLTDTKTQLSTKQDTLTAGPGIVIASNIISVREEVLYDEWYYPNKKPTTDLVNFRDSYEVLQPTAYVGDYTDADGTQWTNVFECESFPDWFDWSIAHCHPYNNGIAVGVLYLNSFEVTDAGEVTYYMYNNGAISPGSAYNCGCIKKIDDTHFVLYGNKSGSAIGSDNINPSTVDASHFGFGSPSIREIYDVTDCKKLRIEWSGQIRLRNTYSDLISVEGSVATGLRGYYGGQVVYGTTINDFEISDDKTKYRVTRSNNSMFYRTNVNGNPNNGGLKELSSDFVMTSRWYTLNQFGASGLCVIKSGGKNTVVVATNGIFNPSGAITMGSRLRIIKLE